jgi:hypothetical protein
MVECLIASTASTRRCLRLAICVQRVPSSPASVLWPGLPVHAVRPVRLGVASCDPVLCTPCAHDASRVPGGPCHHTGCGPDLCGQQLHLAAVGARPTGAPSHAIPSIIPGNSASPSGPFRDPCAPPCHGVGNDIDARAAQSGAIGVGVPLVRSIASMGRGLIISCPRTPRRTSTTSSTTPIPDAHDAAPPAGVPTDHCRVAAPISTTSATCRHLSCMMESQRG